VRATSPPSVPPPSSGRRTPTPLNRTPVARDHAIVLSAGVLPARSVPPPPPPGADEPVARVPGYRARPAPPRRGGPPPGATDLEPAPWQTGDGPPPEAGVPHRPDPVPAVASGR
jgi:hypothetical protein